MNEQNFDNKLRDSLGDYRSKLDTGALWEQLEPQLAADKKRRRGIFWWWSGAGALLALGAWAWFALQNPKSVSSSPDRTVESRTATQLPETVATAQGTQSAAHTMSETTTPANQVEETPETEKEAIGAKPKQIPVVEMPEQLVSKLPKSASKPGSKRNLNPTTPLKQSTPPASNQTPANLTASRPTNPVVMAPGLPSDAGAVQEPGFAQQQKTNTIAQLENAPISGVSSSMVAGETQAIAPLSPLAWLELKSLLTTDQMPPVLPVTLAKPEKKAAKTDLLIRPNFEIGYTFKMMDREYADSLPALQARLGSEEALEYLHGNLLLGARHRTGWYALTGLGYTRITERFSFNTERTERDSVDGITEIYINAQGDSIFTEGLVQRTRHISYRKRTYSSYTLLDVPLIAGYDWEKGRWSYGAEAGIFLNISLKAKGDALDRYSDFVRLEDTDWFKPRIGISYYGSLRIGYALDDKTRISLGPTFRYVPNVTETNYTQRYGLLGLNIGIARRF